MFITALVLFALTSRSTRIAPIVRHRARKAVAIALIAALVIVATPGCATHRVLQQKTTAANLTVTDIYYEQVLNNLARFVDNPGAMPSFSVVTAGTVNIQDSAGASIAPNYSPTLTTKLQGGGALPILSILFGANGSRTVSENWSTAPLTDSDNIRRMRCAFQLLLDAEASECDRCRDRLQGFFHGGTESFECMIPRDWFSVGRCEDVPEDASYVGSHGDTYVWVMPEGVDGLSRFTITVLDIATGEVHAPQRTVTKRYKGDPESENLVETEVTSTETDKDALKEAESFQLDRQRLDMQTPNRGLFFLPR